MIALGSDHAGYRLKLSIVRLLLDMRLDFNDFGCNSTDSCDYPDFAQKVAFAVAGGDASLGLLFCGTGVGMSIAANKVRGIRAAVCSETFSAVAARLHNNANILCVGERVVGEGLATDIVRAFLLAEFEGGRHARRLQLVDEIERNGQP